MNSNSRRVVTGSRLPDIRGFFRGVRGWHELGAVRMTC